MSKTANKKFAPEVRARPVRVALDHEGKYFHRDGQRFVDSSQDRLHGADAL
ncbi:hypothetical protein IB238_17415 [Rhizobium sp. ARZ01]|uniref:hypothetical protein n=1 Tax=Rhizobium sp. ARZ01 TaxID=2769313 RepID=UPI00178296D6|nr:hypothetical protein [Rhizobium sp. ARZ01]MBD9374404.1 hypothetical protein [Rhizobium sp. ARZ01]